MGFSSSNGDSGCRHLRGKGAPRKEEEVKISLKEIRLNKGGYDSRGGYFGVGPKLYQVEADGEYVGNVRAKGNFETKAKIIERVKAAIATYGNRGSSYWG